MSDRFRPQSPAKRHRHPDLVRTAARTPYDNSESGLIAEQLQDAIDELATLIAAAATAAGITVTDTADHYTGTDVEAILAEIGVILAALADTYVKTTGGGGELVEDHGAAGSSETIDLADGNIHIVELDDDCTFTFTGFDTRPGISFVILLDQDGTGGHATTWPAAVNDAAGLSSALDDTASTRQIVSFFSPDGGTTIYWAILGAAGSGGAPAAHASSHENGGSDEISVAGLSGLLADAQTALAHASSHEPGGGDAMDVDAAANVGSLRTLGTGATQAALGNHTHAGTDPSLDTAAWMPLTSVVGGDPVLVWDGNDSLIPTLVPL